MKKITRNNFPDRFENGKIYVIKTITKKPYDTVVEERIVGISGDILKSVFAKNNKTKEVKSKSFEKQNMTPNDVLDYIWEMLKHPSVKNDYYESETEVFTEDIQPDENFSAPKVAEILKLRGKKCTPKHKDTLRQLENAYKRML